MGRKKAMFAMECLVIAGLIVLTLLPACRKEAVPIDRNRAPETFITSSPTETIEADYRVHMYWHGVDEDGTVVRYIWYVSDTVTTLDPVHNPNAALLDWNPSERIADYLKGHFTSKTDTVILFHGYDDKTGALVNRQAFHVAAIDDGGKIDPIPARLQFKARVRGIPQVRFWINISGRKFPNGEPDTTDVPYNPRVLDTISMFKPFKVKFTATTINNVITGYRWSYGGVLYPDFNGDGNPDWLVPVDPLQKVSVVIGNRGAGAQPSGTFNLKVIARDEAGALSRSDIITGEGVARVVINHDPDTRILRGTVFYTPQSTGIPESLTTDFSGGLLDTLPYRSQLRFEYAGWDDKRDSLQFQPPLPIRFQFSYRRLSHDQYGNVSAEKTSPWYPLKTPENTNPNDTNDLTRDTDSTSFHVGTFDYDFYVRSFDEQNRPDGTPAQVKFVGNFKPELDSLRVGFVIPSGEFKGQFRGASHDTIYIGWDMARFNQSSGDTIGPGSSPINDPVLRTQTRSFKLVLRAGGHDDRRDPPGSGVKGWKYWVFGPNGGYPFPKQGEWQFDATVPPTNLLNQALTVSITVPLDSASSPTYLPPTPAWMGRQTVRVVGQDLKDTDTFVEGVRGISPEYNASGQLVISSDWVQNEYQFSAYSRNDTLVIPVYLKLVK